MPSNMPELSLLCKEKDPKQEGAFKSEGEFGRHGRKAFLQTSEKMYNEYLDPKKKKMVEMGNFSHDPQYSYRLYPDAEFPQMSFAEKPGVPTKQKDGNYTFALQNPEKQVLCKPIWTQALTCIGGRHNFKVVLKVDARFHALLQETDDAGNPKHVEFDQKGAPNTWSPNTHWRQIVTDASGYHSLRPRHFRREADGKFHANLKFHEVGPSDEGTGKVTCTPTGPEQEPWKNTAVVPGVPGVPDEKKVVPTIKPVVKVKGVDNNTVEQPVKGNNNWVPNLAQKDTGVKSLYLPSLYVKTNETTCSDYLLCPGLPILLFCCACVAAGFAVWCFVFKGATDDSDRGEDEDDSTDDSSDSDSAMEEKDSTA